LDLFLFEAQQTTTHRKNGNYGRSDGPALMVAVFKIQKILTLILPVSKSQSKMTEGRGWQMCRDCRSPSFHDWMFLAAAAMMFGCGSVLVWTRFTHFAQCVWHHK
jgi:hypothetical protein